MKWNKKTMSLGMKMSFRDFFRTFLATTISIVLTFGNLCCSGAQREEAVAEANVHDASA